MAILGQLEIFGMDRAEVDRTFVLLGNAGKIREIAKKYGPATERAARASGWN